MRLCLALLAVLACLAAASPADAQKRCKKGIPCGNSCIAAGKTCRVGPGTTTAGPAATKAVVSADVSAPTSAAQGEYVASSRGRVYYWVGCSAWKTLSKANLRWFRTAKEAETAGYTPSAARGCAGPAGARE